MKLIELFLFYSISNSFNLITARPSLCKKIRNKSNIFHFKSSFNSLGCYLQHSHWVIIISSSFVFLLYNSKRAFDFNLLVLLTQNSREMGQNERDKVAVSQFPKALKWNWYGIGNTHTPSPPTHTSLLTCPVQPCHIHHCLLICKFYIFLRYHQFDFIPLFRLMDEIEMFLLNFQLYILKHTLTI